MSVESALSSAFDEFRRVVRTIVQQLDDDELKEYARPYSGERPYGEGRDAHMGWVALRAAARVEARRRGLVK